VQLAPAPRLEPHVLLWSKSVALVPVIAMPLISSSEPPVLVRVSTCGLLVVPTTDTPKLRLAGARTRVGGVGGNAGDPPPQPASKDNTPNTSANCFFTVPPPHGSDDPRKPSAGGELGIFVFTDIDRLLLLPRLVCFYPVPERDSPRSDPYRQV